MKKRFRELLGSMEAQPMKEQEQRLIKIIQDWKGEQPQTDDICVLGLRFS